MECRRRRRRARWIVLSYVKLAGEELVESDCVDVAQTRVVVEGWAGGGTAGHERAVDLEVAPGDELLEERCGVWG